jgi:succinate dehydrogenase / fumarate reductase, cytochrome b subunit
MAGPTKPSHRSIGSKALMALTGLVLVAFVVGHMLGNLQIFAGPEALNGYATKLRELGPLLWAARLFLLAAFVLHVWTAYRVWRANRAARPVRYQRWTAQVTDPAARTMMLSGVVVLVFVVYHLLHLTFGVTNPEHFAEAHAQPEIDVYEMTVKGFKIWYVTAAYVVAQLFLGAHLWHGTSSAFQTLGVTHPRLGALKSWVGPAVAVVVVAGNVAIPLAVVAGLVGRGVV